MSTATWVAITGSLGGLCTTLAFVPQVIKMWKQGGRDVSYAMLALYLAGALLWLTYGVLLHTQAVILANSATALIVSFAAGIKAWTARRDLQVTTAGLAASAERT